MNILQRIQAAKEYFKKSPINQAINQKSAMPLIRAVGRNPVFLSTGSMGGSPSPRSLRLAETKRFHQGIEDEWHIKQFEKSMLAYRKKLAAEARAKQEKIRQKKLAKESERNTMPWARPELIIADYINRFKK